MLNIEQRQEKSGLMIIKMNGKPINSEIYQIIADRAHAAKSVSPTVYDKLLYPLPLGIINKIKLLYLRVRG